MTLLFYFPLPPGAGGRSCSCFLVGYKISPLSVLSFANCAPALGRGIGQAPIIAAYRRALPLLVWIYELSFFVPIITGGKPRSRFWAEYKISPLSVWIFAGQPVQVGYHSPPFRAGVGANTDPRRPLQGQAHAAPRFLRDAAHFPPASKPQPAGRRFTARRRSLQREGGARRGAGGGGPPAPTLPAQQTARVLRPVRFLEGEIMKMRGCRFYLAMAAFRASFLASSRLTMTAQAASPTMLMVVRPISNRRSMP